MKRGVLLALALTGAAFAQAPAWFKEAATATHPAYAAKVPAVVLLNQEMVVMEDASKKTHTIRFVVKVLNREGAREAERGVVYFSKGGKVRDAKAWLIMPSGRTKDYGKNDIVDRALMTGVYDEYRYLGINARDEADPGAVFGFEATVEEKTSFTQFDFDFQDDLPAVRSSFTLTLPAGWRAEGQVLGDGANAKEAIKPDVTGSVNPIYQWQMVRLNPFDREPDSPRMTSLNPRLVVNTFPPQGAGQASDGGESGYFQSWRDVSVWTSKLVDPSAAVTPEIEARVKTLAGSATGFWEKLRPLAAEAQKIRYISISLNLARGGGYTPHLAADVLRNAYGDCKDKANYLRTLLKVVGIESYLVPIYSGDPRHTRAEWPSPHQFNHAILAIKVPDDTKLPSAFDFPGLGRMMLFDPTDDVVPLGFMPDHEQDSNALLLAGAKGGLFRTPTTTPAENLLTRTVRLTLSPTGDLAAATIRDTSIGEPAFNQLRNEHDLPAGEFEKRLQRRFGSAMAGAAITQVDRKADANRAGFEMNVALKAPGYAKMMQGRLMMFKPVVLAYGGMPDVTLKERTHPVVIDPVAFEEHVEVELPMGFAVDEIPDADTAETPYGKYQARWRQEAGKVYFDRRLELRSTVVPVADYGRLRDFVGRVQGAEQTPVVLVRK